MGPPGLDVLLDSTQLQQEQDSASRLCITHTCNTRQQQPFEPYEDEGLLTLIFIDQPAGLQVSFPCVAAPSALSDVYTSRAQVLVQSPRLADLFLWSLAVANTLPWLLLIMLACCLPLSEIVRLQVWPPTDTGINIPGGHVVVLPGHTLEHATCGLFMACKYRLVSPFCSQ